MGQIVTELPALQKEPGGAGHRVDVMVAEGVNDGVPLAVLVTDRLCVGDLLCVVVRELVAEGVADIDGAKQLTVDEKPMKPSRSPFGDDWCAE